MSRFADPRHLAGLVLSIALAAVLWAWWPWPFEAVRSAVPHFHKTHIRPLFGDYQRLIGYLFPILILSIVHGIWTRLPQRKNGEEDGS